jgi:hypothetical protein
MYCNNPLILLPTIRVTTHSPHRSLDRTQISLPVRPRPASLAATAYHRPPQISTAIAEAPSFSQWPARWNLTRVSRPTQSYVAQDNTTDDLSLRKSKGEGKGSNERPTAANRRAGSDRSAAPTFVAPCLRAAKHAGCRRPMRSRSTKK